MTWEEKTEMIQLANNVKDQQSRRKFLKYVIDHIANFDIQAYDMFITALALNEIELEPELHEKIYPFIKDLSEKGNSEISLRTALRLEMYIGICEKDLKISK